MNKSERNKLSDIIASMIYSDSTTPEVADYGHQLLKAFPCIEELMCNSQEEVLEDNIACKIKQFLSYNNNPLSLSKYQDWETVEKVSDVIWCVLFDYLHISNKNTKDLYEDLSSEYLISRLIASDEWIEAVNINTEDFKVINYLTNSGDY